MKIYASAKYLIPLIIFSIIIFFYGCGDNTPGGVVRDSKESNINYNLSPEYYKTAARVDSFFQNRHKRGLFNGTVLFAEKNNVIYENALGYGNFRKKDTLEIDSKFQLASVSKTITSYAVMLLEQQGEISYRDSIRQFFPDFPYENITIRQLLIHRSGLPAYMYFADEYWKEPGKDITINNMDVIDLMIEYEPMRYYYPGQRYNYSNTNYCILAAIVAKVSGKSFEDFLTDEVFTPLGMLNTSIYNREEEPDNPYPVIGYKGRRRAGNTYLNGVVGDKGVYSTVEDLFRLNLALNEGSLVTKENLKEAYIPAHEELYDYDNYGYGWRINMRPDSSKVVYHTGWWKGFRSYFIRELETGKCIIVLTNRSRSGVFSTKELMRLFDIKSGDDDYSSE